ncbi:transporter substrate-binding domain-containing protein [Desulfovibrio mangrovi]|uniref:substrate-binding periplasmic protein n=1 Tax=Desulfovibrio mangrovi TaxID=2976983 RepID=UPI002247D1CB|nr:transporter substrate-binding domain-containing protein [Desulfovibrio mangrovi]UZP67204.1 transporter substrate-binding domain-containing protein [Desulfovibrio mangrovi]
MMGVVLLSKIEFKSMIPVCCMRWGMRGEQMFRVLSLVIICLLGVNSSAAAADVRLAIPDWPPFSSSELPDNGVMTDLVVSAFHESGYAVTVTMLPWKRALLKGEEGEVDAVLGASYLKEREACFLYSQWCYRVEPYFFCMAREKEYEASVEDLCPATLGVYRGSVFLKELAETCLTIEEGNDHEQNLKKLGNERLDYALTHPEVVLYMVQTGAISPGLLHVCGKPYAQDAVHVVFSRRNGKAAQLAAAFDEGMLKLLQSGEYDAILKRHGIDNEALKELGIMRR